MHSNTTIMIALVTMAALILASCSSNDLDTTITTMDQVEETQVTQQESARVTKVTVSGEANNYNFSVTIASPDTGCDQYADWWEVFTEDGVLIYRRILAHSHVTEQPFTRSGGAVNIGPDDVVYVRAHMNNLGYGTAVYRGTVAGGFTAETIAIDQAANLESQDPLPGGCAF